MVMTMICFYHLVIASNMLLDPDLTFIWECPLRLLTRAKEIDDLLVAVETKITDSNTKGIIAGFKSEFLEEEIF